MGEHNAVVAICYTHAEVEAAIKEPSHMRPFILRSSRSSCRMTVQPNMREGIPGLPIP